MILHLVFLLWVGGADGDESPRRELAVETYSWLYEHALCAEPATEPPCDWVYDGAYDLHRAARELWDLRKPLRSIKLVESDYARGGYVPLTLATQLSHDWLVTRVNFMIQFGEEEEPDDAPHFIRYRAGPSSGSSAGLLGSSQEPAG